MTELTACHWAFIAVATVVYHVLLWAFLFDVSFKRKKGK